jgi:Ca-activated chloride channel family protein
MKHFSRALLPFVLLLSALSAASAQNLSASAPREADLVNVRTDLVSVTVTVTDREGRHFPGLRREAFTLYEDDVAQEIVHFSAEDRPASIGIVFDLSASMKGAKLRRAAEALGHFVRTTHRDDEFSLVTFNDQAEVLMDSIRDGDTLVTRISSVLPRGNTALYDAIALGLRQVTRGAQQKRALIVITDGDDNHSRLSEGRLRRLAQEAGVPIYGIIIRDFLPDRSGPPPLEELSKITGGRSFFPGDGEELSEAFEQIALELRHQYSVGYVPSNFVADGKWRRLKVRIARSPETPRLLVRSRQGYYAVPGSFARQRAEADGNDE